MRGRRDGGQPGPSSSSLPTLVERRIVEKYLEVGIGGDRKIPVTDAVSAENRIPEEVKALGYLMIKFYIDERIKVIEAHNKVVLERVREDTLDLKEATLGRSVIICPACMEDVPWGAIMLHRTKLCVNCRV